LNNLSHAARSKKKKKKGVKYAPWELTGLVARDVKSSLFAGLVTDSGALSLAGSRAAGANFSAELDLALQSRIPVVFDRVSRTAIQKARNSSPFVTQLAVRLDNNSVFLRGPCFFSDFRTQMIEPSNKKGLAQN
jgi:hypothetical protein